MNFLFQNCKQLKRCVLLKCCHCFCIECLTSLNKPKKVHNNVLVCLKCHTACPNNGRDLFYSKMQEYTVYKYFKDEYNEIFKRPEPSKKN